MIDHRHAAPCLVTRRCDIARCCCRRARFVSLRGKEMLDTPPTTRLRVFDPFEFDDVLLSDDAPEGDDDYDDDDCGGEEEDD